MKIVFGGHDLVLHPSGMVLWPRYRRAIVTDLHLEKGSHFARRGYFLPPYDTHETLIRLHEVCKTEHIAQLILLGDCFHDPTGFQRLFPADQNLFDGIKRYDPVWIKGNHDKNFVPDGFLAFDVLESEGLLFRHEAEGESNPEISGHFHPKTDILHKGAQLSRPCFIEDGKKLILPAFGAYTGGLKVTDEAISHHFPLGYRLYVPGISKTYSV